MVFGVGPTRFGTSVAVDNMEHLPVVLLMDAVKSVCI